MAEGIKRLSPRRALRAINDRGQGNRMDESIWELMGHGAGAMWVVLGFSVLAMAVGIERAIAQWKFVTRARQLGEVVNRCLARGATDEARSACERSPSPVADVFLVGFEK